MVLSNEPGYYRAEEFGIRISENLGLSWLNCQLKVISRGTNVWSH